MKTSTYCFNEKYSITVVLSKLPYYRGARRLPTAKDLHLRCENAVNILHAKHSCSFYSITIRLVPLSSRTADDEWRALPELVNGLSNALQKHYLVAGAVLGIEISQKVQGRSNTFMAGRPHVHIFLAVYNDFLSPSVFDVREDLSLNSSWDVQVKPVPSSTQAALSKDVCAALKYPLKDSRSQLMQEACSHYLNSTPAMIHSNNRLVGNPFVSLGEYLKLKGYPLSIVAHGNSIGVPSVQRYDRSGGFVVQSRLQMAAFIRNVCLQEGLAFYKGHLWRLESPSLYTWSRWISVTDFGARVLGNLDLPAAYLAKYHSSAAWVLGEGSSTKLEASTQVFPRLNFAAHHWEFNDGLYDLLTGDFITKAIPFTSASVHHRINFETLIFPNDLLAFMHKLCNPNQNVMKLLLALGSLFHELHSTRKESPALWLHGKSNTYKSWFLVNFLKTNFCADLVFGLPKQGDFKYASLCENTNRGVIFMDEFRSSNFTSESSSLISLLDNSPLDISRKHLPSKEIVSKHNWVVSTNESLNQTAWGGIDRIALTQRWLPIEFKKQKSKKSTDELKSLTEEFAGLGLLANYVYIKETYGREARLPGSWKLKALT